jgi:RimJ/RimL family protein N-acetyltransferase
MVMIDDTQFARQREAPRATCATRLIDVWRAKTGASFTLRPVLPRDLRPLGEMFGRLSRSTSYNRFHGTMSVPPALLHALTHVDQQQHLALVVTTMQGGNEIIAAEARYVVDEDGVDAEFAIVVEDRWQRLGIATRIMQALVAAARTCEVPRLYGSVLTDNAAMLGLMKRCGFSCASDPTDRRLARAELRLNSTAGSLPAGASAGGSRAAYGDDLAAWLGGDALALY